MKKLPSICILLFLWFLMTVSIVNSYNPVNTAVIIAKSYSDDRKGIAQSLLIADEKALFDRGLKAAEEGKDREAIDLLTRVIFLNSRSADAYIIRAQVFQRMLQYQEALKDYDSLFKLVKDSKALDQIYGMRGDLYRSLRRFPEAIADFTKALEMNPNDMQALFLRGNSHYLTGRPDDAISDFALLLKKKPDDVETLYNMGLAYSNKNDFAEAVRLYDKVTAINPADAFSIYSRAQAYYCLGAYEKALEDLQKCMKLGHYDEYCRIWTLLIMKQIKADGYDRYADEFKMHISLTKPDEWIRIVSKYLLELDAVSQADVIAEAKKAKSNREKDERLCEAYLFLAMKSLQKGDTRIAADFLQKSLDTMVYEFYEYVTAGVLLKSIRISDKKG